MTITKTPNPTTYSLTEFTYTYTVNNTGNVALTDVLVIDSQLGTISLLNNNLAPNAQTTGTATYTTTQSDYDNGSITNTATVYNGTTPLNQTQATITAINKIQLWLIKSANPKDYSTEGRNITYTYTVTNSGNVTISAPITVTDDKFGTISIQGDVSLVQVQALKIHIPTE